MNKTAIKNYAIWARVQLIESCKQRAFEYGITEDENYAPNLKTIGSHILTDDEAEQRNQLISQIKQKGYGQVMEEAAYTWFNRFIALRFMEVNGYLPSKVRVFTDETDAFKPEILKEAMTVDLEGINREVVMHLLEKQDNDALYKYLLVTQCNALSTSLPFMFEKISNWTELLFPANLLRPESVVGRLISDIPEEDWTDAVQIIGWLYQYYNSELKDETFALLKKNVKITKERIPAATQLFTPDWIVRYMVENSLGRLWYEGHKDFDKSQWTYYLDKAEQEPEVEAELSKIGGEYSRIRPEEIKVIDPCMGSGHILVYAFDVLMQIYTSAGWSERDAARSIVENNLYGLDIDDRAGQLAYFAVMMKARKYSRRFLSFDVKPNVMPIQDSSFMTNDLIDFVAGNSSKIKAELRCIKEVFTDAKEYGSILDVPMLGYNEILERIEELKKNGVEDIFQIEYRTTVVEQLCPLIRQAMIMSQKYDVVVTNPPYMGSVGMSAVLVEYLKNHYPNEKADLFAAFMKKGRSLTNYRGFTSLVTMQSWMFLSTFEKVRDSLLHDSTITCLMHMSNMVMGIAFGTAVTITTNKIIRGYRATYNYIKAEDIINERPYEFPIMDNRFAQVPVDNFSKIPGTPIAYWINDKIAEAFDNGIRIGNIGNPKQGMIPGNVNEFLRLWYEVDINRIGFNHTDHTEIKLLGYKWFPYNKGGSFRKWAGNLEYIINMGNDGHDIKYSGKNNNYRLREPELYFKEAVTWSKVTNGGFSARYMPKGNMFDIAGCCVFSLNNNLKYTLGFMNSVVCKEILSLISPTMNYEVEHIKSLPVIFDEQYRNTVESLVEENITISEEDWDSCETSWNYKCHPFITGDKTIEEAFEKWSNSCEKRFKTLKSNEEQLNQIFINIYGLNNALSPLVEDKDVTVRTADLNRDIRSFISYAVGCMFGRYSVDYQGLAFAGGRIDKTKYITVPIDNDAIIPICDDEYFNDDIAERFINFVSLIYGADTLEENLMFIAKAIGTKGTPREVIRNYFINDFYIDHLKQYQKRPIYWLFSSGKKNGFKALVYMHRYRPDLLACMRTDYVHEQQERYRTQLQMMEEKAQNASPSERVIINKQIGKLRDQSQEIQKYEEKVHHLADQMIPIDLDDGVKANYARFQDVLEKIK